MNVKLDKINQKIIGQIQFRPSLESFSSSPVIAKTLEKKFEEWQVKGDNITLYSPEKSKLTQIFFDKITYLSEENANFDELHDYLEKIYNKLMDFSVEEIRRVGVRNTVILKSSFSFSELVELMYKKFYPRDDAFLKLSGGNPKDVIFVLDSERNGFLNHIRIGPVNKEEAEKHFNSSFGVDVKAEENGNIFMDIDVFKIKDLTKDSAVSELKKAIEENKSLSGAYLEHLIS